MNCEPSIPSCHSGHNSASEGNTEILELLVLAVGTQLPEVLAESRRRAESNVGAHPPSKVAGGVVETRRVVAPSSLRCWLSHGDVLSQMSAPSPRARWLAESLRQSKWWHPAP